MWPVKAITALWGGPAGDLIVVIEEVPSEEFVRDGNNLLYELYVSFSDAVLGAKKEIPTVEGGKVRITLEKGTQSGKILRLKGKGLPDFQRSGKGDMLVYVACGLLSILARCRNSFSNRWKTIRISSRIRLQARKEHSRTG